MSHLPVSVVSWNCLADCYSHTTTADKDSAQTIASWSFRFDLIKRALTCNDADIVCLQEVDHFDDSFKPFLIANHYDFEYAQRPGRQDGLLIAFKRQKFFRLKSLIVHHDDLARVNPSILRPLRKSALQRHNIALVVLLRVLPNPNVSSKYLQSDVLHHGFPLAEFWSGRSIAVCTTHLFWNPAFPDIKLTQAMYLLERLVNVRMPPFDMTPVATIVTGDFNSEPNTAPLSAMCTGAALAPMPRKECHVAARIAVARVKRWKKQTDASSNVMGFMSGEDTRFLCDATLTKLTRWLRLVGVNTAIEDRASQELRAQTNDFLPLFNRAREERRVLVTTSSTMYKRNTCPEAFLIRPPESNDKLMQSFADLLNHYDVQLRPEKFLLLCSKCGETIVQTSIDDKRIDGKFAPADRDIFICEGCYQVYWCSTSSTGCSTRANKLAKTLYARVESSRYKIKGQKNHNDIDLIANQNPLEMVPPCRQEWLRLRSAFYLVHGKEPNFTNVNGTYQGTLDYIFIGGALSARNATVSNHMSSEPILNEVRSCPNEYWPSDHMLVRADLIMSLELPPRLWFPRTLSDTQEFLANKLGSD